MTVAPERYDAGMKQENGVGRLHEGKAILTDNEQCVLAVLKIKNNLTTKQFLGIAEDIALCKDCKDENAVINAAETLIKMGLVAREFKKGKYIWSLKSAEVSA